MKLVYFIPDLSNPGGMERILLDKVNYLSTLDNFDITIITTEKSLDTFYSLNPSITRVNLEINFNDYFNKSFFNKFVSRFQKIRKYRKVLKHIFSQKKFDLYITLGGKELFFLHTIVDPLRIIVELHFSRYYYKSFGNLHYNSKLYSLVGMFNQFHFERILRKISIVVVLTKADLIDWKGVLKNIICIPNFTNIIRSDFYNLNSRNIISVGRLDEQKGYDLLIRSFANVSHLMSGWEIHVYGEGPMRSHLEKLILNYGLQERFKLMGISQNLDELYREYSYFACSSRYEGFAIAMLEAMSCSLPIISFNCPNGPSDLIVNNVNGYLIDNYDIEILSKRILDLSLDKNKRQKFSNASFNRSLEYDQKKIMSIWIGLFQNLLSNKY